MNAPNVTLAGVFAHDLFGGCLGEVLRQTVQCPPTFPGIPHGLRNRQERITQALDHRRRGFWGWLWGR